MSLDKLSPEVTDLIESLSARVDELEAQNIGINGGDFTGRKYCLHGYGREQTGGNNAGIYYAHYRAVMRFTSPTQVSVKDLGEVEAFLQIPSPHGNDTETSGARPSEIYPYVVIGNTLTINLGSEDGEQDYFISPDGNF